MTPPLATATLILIIGAAVVAQKSATRSADNDWPMHSRDFTGSRFSPLADIDTGNVSQLRQAWSVPLTMPGGRGRGAGLAAGAAPGVGRAEGRAAQSGRAGGATPEGADNADDDAVTSNPQVTPIVIDGVMYLPARGNQVLALDADTGKEIYRGRSGKQFVSAVATDTLVAFALPGLSPYFKSP